MRNNWLLYDQVLQNQLFSCKIGLHFGRKWDIVVAFEKKMVEKH